MEDNVKLIEDLLQRATEYAKASFELIKLKTLDKMSDIASSVIPHSIVFIFVLTALLFLNFGLVFWLGEVLGKTFYGFFIVAAFYLVIGILVHFVLHKWIKKAIYNYIIKQIFK